MISRNVDYSIQRFRGLSTDTKPTDVPNGSEFREMDTGKDFMYDEASGDWKEQPERGGGGGGGGAFVVRKSNGALDKTFSEIKSALDSGMVVMFHFFESTPALKRDKLKYLVNLSDSGRGSSHRYIVEFTHGENDATSDYTFTATSENGALEPSN